MTIGTAPIFLDSYRELTDSELLRKHSHIGFAGVYACETVLLATFAGETSMIVANIVDN